jgi:RND superfamily putative drug exporter
MTPRAAACQRLSMNHLLERLGGFAARRFWVFIVAWLIILGGLLGANHAFGGKYVNDYTVPGSGSSNGLNLLNSDYPQKGGFGGQIVFHASHGTVAQQQSAVNQATSNVSKLAGVTSAVSPFASSKTGAVSKNGTIAYSSVTWGDNPAGLDTSYLNQLNKAVAPARKAGLEVQYGGGAGQIGQDTGDTKSEVIGLACALVLLLFMFGSFITAAIPLVSAIFAVGAGLSVVGLLAAVSTFPSVAPTVATLLGLGVAVDYGLFLTARHREQLDQGMDVVQSATKAEGTSGASIVIAGSTVVVAILGLYLSGVPFVGAMGAAAAIVVLVTMMAALTLVPSFMGLVRSNIRSLPARIRAHREGQADRRGHRGAARAERVRPVGPQGRQAAVAVGHRQRAGARGAGDPAAVDQSRPARPWHQPAEPEQQAGLRPAQRGIRRRDQRPAHRRGQAAQAVEFGHPVAAELDDQERRGHQRGRVGVADVGEQCGDRRRLQRDPDDPAAGHGNERPGKDPSQ